MAPKGPWSSSEVLEVASAESHEPAVAMLGETLHLVWNCNRQLYHAWRTTEGWSQATMVAIGEQPALAATPDGQLHCLFVNQFARNVRNLPCVVGWRTLVTPGQRLKDIRRIQPAGAGHRGGRLPARCMGRHHPGLLGCLLRHA